MFLTGIDTGSSNLAAANADANVIFTDGTMDTVTVNMRKSEDVDGDRLPGGSQVNTWCTYTVSSDGVYTLKQVDTTSGHKVMQSAENVDGTDEIKIDNKHVSMRGILSYDANSNGIYDTGDTSSRVYGNDDTVYLNVELKGIANARDNNNKSWIIDDVESVTVGSKNVALTVWNANHLFKDANGDGEVDAQDNGYTYPNAEIYPLFDDDNYVIAVVTIAENEGSTTNYAYITGDVNSEAYGNDEYTWTLPAIVNGKKVELTEIGDTLDVLDELDKGNWYKIKYDADGYVRGYEAIENQITDGDYDSSDCYINDVAHLEGALEVNDTVLLDQDFTKSHGILTFENGTLYTDTKKTEGININPDVKVVLALADKNQKPFDDVDDSYTGYSGLEKALRNLDTEATDTNGDGVVDYNFNGNLAAIVEGGDGATTIILDDRSGKADPDYNPLKDMKVTINLIDRTYFYPQVLSTVTDTLDQDDFKKAGGTITYTAAQFEGNLAGLDNYKAFPDKQSYPITRFEEGKEVSIDFYYRVEEEVTQETVLTISAADETALVSINGVSKGDGSKLNDVSAGDVVTFKLTNGPEATGDDNYFYSFNGGVAVQTTKNANNTVVIKEGANTLKVWSEAKTYAFSVAAPDPNWEVVEDVAGNYAKGEEISFTLKFKGDHASDFSAAGFTPKLSVTPTGGSLTVDDRHDGKAPVAATYQQDKSITSQTAYDDAIAAGTTLYVKDGTDYVLAPAYIDGVKYYTVKTPGVDGVQAYYELTYKMGTADSNVTLKW